MDAAAELGRNPVSTRFSLLSMEMRTAVPSYISLLISIIKLNLVLAYGILPDFRGGVYLFI